MPDCAKHITHPVPLNPHKCPKVSLQPSPLSYRCGHRLRNLIMSRGPRVTKLGTELRLFASKTQFPNHHFLLPEQAVIQ